MLFLTFRTDSSLRVILNWLEAEHSVCRFSLDVVGQCEVEDHTSRLTDRPTVARRGAQGWLWLYFREREEIKWHSHFAKIGVACLLGVLSSFLLSHQACLAHHAA